MHEKVYSSLPKETKMAMSKLINVYDLSPLELPLHLKDAFVKWEAEKECLPEIRECMESKERVQGYVRKVTGIPYGHFVAFFLNETINDPEEFPEFTLTLSHLEERSPSFKASKLMHGIEDVG